MWFGTARGGGRGWFSSGCLTPTEVGEGVGGKCISGLPFLTSLGDVWLSGLGNIGGGG